jgi:predicted SnoaL-like aldol condensation-catalyzing enzyme
VKAFYELAFNDGQPQQARDEYLSHTYTQHKLEAQVGFPS